MTRGVSHRAVLGLAALVVLLGVVVVASPGSVPPGTGGIRAPPRRPDQPIAAARRIAVLALVALGLGLGGEG